MGEVMDYQSRLSDPGSRKYETFSYLPQMTVEQIRRQVEYIVAKGWNPAVEHTEPEGAFGHYWYMWKLPLFGERNVDAIFSEITACRKKFPGHYVRVVGYDNGRQTQGARIVVYHGDRRTN